MSNIEKFEGEKVRFWADTHFSHTNIITYCKRPFHNAEHMDKALMSEFMNADEAGVTIFHLGDFAFNLDFVRNFDWRPKGNHYIILGNHDRAGDEHRKLYREYFHYILGDVKTWKHFYHKIQVDDRIIILSHEAIKFTSETGQVHYNLYGHHHNNMQQNPEKFTEDYGWLLKDTYLLEEFGPTARHQCVSVENTMYRPMTLDQILRRPKEIQH